MLSVGGDLEPCSLLVRDSQDMPASKCGCMRCVSVQTSVGFVGSEGLQYAGRRVSPSCCSL